jgi:hypothetical protein
MSQPRRGDEPLECFHTDLALPSACEDLPVHQRREAICRRAMGELKVLGMLIGGSFASREADTAARQELSAEPTSR